jgi:hypothetical protein
MKIIDTFMFFNEYDILELRLREHYDKVDQFVIVECDKTFTGIHKEFNFEQHGDRFKPWMDKIHHLKLTLDNPNKNAWANEHWQRNQMSLGWQGLGADDVIIMSDVDEILRPETLQYIRDTNYSFYSMAMPTFYFRFNYMDITDNYPWTASAFRGFQTTGQRMREMHEIPGRSKIKLHHAGWHFSYLGDTDALKTKLKSFSHTELNVPSIVNNIDIEQYIANGRDFFRPNEVWSSVKVDEYFPKTILNDLTRYKDLIVPNATKSVQEYWPGQILQERS